MIQNILIDLDGTLTDPKVGITTSARYGLEKVGHPISEDTNIDWIIGPPLKASLAKILNVDADDTLAEQALMAYRERFAVTGLYENHVFEGVAETLAELKRRGYRLFLATAKPTVYAKQILEHFNLAQYFTEIYGSELNGDRTNKGELIQYILEQQGIQANQCIMVGTVSMIFLVPAIMGLSRLQSNTAMVQKLNYSRHSLNIRLRTLVIY